MIVYIYIQESLVSRQNCLPMFWIKLRPCRKPLINSQQIWPRYTDITSCTTQTIPFSFTPSLLLSLTPSPCSSLSLTPSSFPLFLHQLSSQIGSSSEERTRLEELGSELAQLRERMSDVDRAVSTLTDAGIHLYIHTQCRWKWGLHT